MGLSFHYSGKIAKPELLAELIVDVKEIAEVHQWEYTMYERQFPQGSFGKPEYNQSIYGISLMPPGCEIVPICFLSNGRMSDTIHLKLYGNSNDPSEKDYLYMLAVKTQFASVQIHQFLIHLFRYLSEKYFVDFVLIDEGDYWETNDVELLKENFRKNADMISGLSLAIECIPQEKNETMEDYFTRLLGNIQKIQNK